MLCILITIFDRSTNKKHLFNSPFENGHNAMEISIAIYFKQFTTQQMTSFLFANLFICFIKYFCSCECLCIHSLLKKSFWCSMLNAQCLILNCMVLTHLFIHNVVVFVFRSISISNWKDQKRFSHENHFIEWKATSAAPTTATAKFPWM